MAAELADAAQCHKKKKRKRREKEGEKEKGDATLLFYLLPFLIDLVDDTPTRAPPSFPVAEQNPDCRKAILFLHVASISGFPPFHPLRPAGPTSHQSL